MSTPNGTWIVTRDTDSADAVKLALASNHRLAPVRVCGDLRDLTECLNVHPAPVVLVDIDPNPSLMLATLQPIIDSFVHTRFVVLAQHTDSDTVLEAMHAGARHFCVKDSVISDLDLVLSRLVHNGMAMPRHRGTVITVLSASGGCGATTLAVNLAGEMQLLASDPTLLVDLDWRYGAIASHLGVHGNYSVADVLARNETVDAELVRTTAQSYADRLDVLLSPASIDFADPAPIRYERLGDTLQACRTAYRCTVVDAPAIPMTAASTLSDASAMTIIVFQLTVKDIRTTRAIIGALTDRGVPQDRLIPVANRYKRRGQSVGLEDAVKALGGIRPRPLSNDFRSAVHGVNFGQLLDESFPRSPLRRDVRKLAVELFESKTSQMV